MKKLLLTLFALLNFVFFYRQNQKMSKIEMIDLQMPFYENLSATKQNGNWGFVNKENVWVIRPIYKDVGLFNNSFTLVLKSKKEFAFIDTNGKEFEIGTTQSKDENGVIWYECKQNNIWYGYYDGFEIIKTH